MLMNSWIIQLFSAVAFVSPLLATALQNVEAEKLSISSMRPSFGDTNGGTPVILTVGEEQIDLISHCIFADAIVAARKNQSAMTIQCTTTPMTNAGSVPVGLSIDGEDFSVSKHSFEFTEPASFLALAPAGGPELGGTTVTISGSNFVNISELACYFGDVKTEGRFISNEEVACVTPTIRPGSYEVQLSFNGVDIHDTSFLYRAYLQMTALAAAPNFGVNDGGTEISVYGTNFRWEDNLHCRFGKDTKVDATVVGSNIVKCVTPKWHVAASVELAVVSDNGNVAMLDDEFEFYTPLHLSSFQPSSGFLRGGTTVTIHGKYFSQARGPIRCVFGEKFVESTIETDTQIQCTSPSSSTAGEVQIAISHGSDEFKLDSALFSYDNEILIDDSPAVVALTNAEKLVDVHGSPFQNNTDLACRLIPNSIKLNAEFVNDSHVACRMPEGVYPGEYEMTISNNGQEFSDAFLPILVIDPFRVHSINPSIQSLDLVSKVTIEGRNFVELVDLACIIDEKHVTQSHFISSTRIECSIPDEIRVGTIAVALALDDVSISIGPPLSLTVLDLSISSMHPSFGESNGGTPVMLQVNNEAVDVISHCIFGDQIVPSIKIESAIQCTTPPMINAGSVPIGLSVTNGKDFSMSTHTFDFTHPASFSALTPANGPELGGTIVRIAGSNFVSGTDFACYFGDIKSAGRFVSNEEVECVSPVMRPGSYDLRLSFNGIDTLRTAMKFLSNYAIDVLSVTPSMGSVLGGTNVSIIGKSFVPMEFLSCRFGDIDIVPAIFISSTEISCVSPDASKHLENATVVDVQVSLNGVDFSPAMVQFQFSLPAFVHSIHPVQGSVNGGTEVVVKGESFFPSTFPSCVFGNSSVPATVHSESQMSCISPKYTSNEAVPFSITLNGVDRVVGADGTIDYTFLPAIRAISIEPNSGPSVGGTIVTVEGFDFDESLNIRCKFGTSHPINATVVSGEKIQCKSPFHPFGIVPFVLSSEETDVISNDAVFEFYKPPQIIAAYPISGPHHGNTPVKVHGNFFRSTTQYLCHFGGISIPGEFVTVGSIVCPSPEMKNLGDDVVDVTITDRGANFTQESLSFTYVQPPTLNSLSPIHVFFEGGDSIAVTGHGFDSTEEVWCRFSSSLASVNGSGNIIKVRANSVLDNEHVVCASPSYPPIDEQVEVLVALSTNGHDWSTNSLSIYYVPNLSISEVHPSLGTVEGGTIVSVFGTGFFEGDDLWCDFGAAGSMAAKLISYNEVSCLTPSTSVPRNVTVSLNFKGSGDYVSAGQSFTYHRLLSLVDAKPLRGFVGGGTLVTITGTGFIDVPSLSCRFGSTVVDAKYISRNMIECTSPSASGVDKVDLGISLNGVEFASQFMSSEIVFHYDPEIELRGVSPLNVAMSKSSGAAVTKAEDKYITLYGSGFINTTSLSCSFGSDQITTATFITDAEVKCSLPEAGNPGEIQVRISLNGLDFSEQASTVLFVSPAVILDVYPSRVQEGSEIDLFISGDNFVQSSELQCYFGGNHHVPKPATWISESSLMCTSPPLNLTYDGFELLWISNNGGHDLSSSFSLGVTARSRFLSIRPNTGYIGGGTKVSITLSNVQYISNLSCHFGEAMDSAVLVSANHIECVSPPSIDAAGNVTVKVFSDGIHLLAAGSFEYLIPPLLSALHPKMGLTEGGSVISVSGNYLAGLTHCRFSLEDGAFEVTRAIQSSDTSVSCQVPSVERSVDALVQVSHNGQDFVGSDIQFSFKERPRISSIVPSYGSDTGGKMVHILGENFIDGAMMVHFGDVIVRASVISPNLISCISPTLRLGQTSVSVSVRGIDDFVGNETLLYESIQLPQISAIHPNVGIVGRSTQVIVNTTKLFKTERISCHFGDMTVMAVPTSSNAVSCLAPTAQDTTIVDLSISVDGERHLGAGGNHTQFTFVAEPRVLSASPNIGWTTGGDRVFFEVEDMAPFYSSTISCLFGGSDDHVHATIDVENNVVFCVAPRFDRDSMEARALINLMIDDGINAIRMPSEKYSYLEPAIVTKIDPPVGTIRGGTVVKATGINFEGMSGLSLSCMFGDVAVDADIEDENKIICRSPEWSGGPKKSVVSIGIGNSTEMVLQSRSSFEYLAHPSITKILPRFGRTSGGTAVVITGHALSWPDAVKHLSCQFGDAALVPATVVDDNLLCVTPPLATGVSMHEGSFDTNLTLYANHGNIPLASSDELFIYTNGITMNSLSTNSGPFTGGTDITISIIGFRGLPTNSITCIFDEIETSGVYSIVGNNEFVKCTTPAVNGVKSSQTVLLRLGIDESDVISNGELFTFYSPPTVNSIFPSYGFYEGGEEVLITGTYFRNATSLSCYFGNVPSPQIQWISDASILCTSPLIENKENSPRVNVTVTNNGVDFTHTSSLTEYEYTHRPDASLVWPSLMNEENRTSIVIKGKGLSRVEACLFGIVKHRYHAFNVTDNSIHCDVPPVVFEGPPQFIPIFLALENGVLETDLNIRYEAPPVIPETIKEPIVAAVEPRLGASAGGGWIRVTGEGFLSRAELACKFGETASREVQHVSSEEVLCKIPRHLPGKVKFSVTNGGIEEGKSKLFEFTFVTDVSITSIFPSSGSVEGGTITRIYGSFSALAGIQPKCKFGTAGVVGGVLVSQNEIHCVSPPAAMVETVELRLSIDNGHNFVLSSSWFTYTLAIKVEALIPSFGFRSGGTPILVTGRNFRNESGLSCKFGEASVAAIFISRQKVSCVHPPRQDQDGTEDQVIFTMISDSGESTSWKYFEYIDDPVVASFHPLVGTSLGGADVVIRGTSFQNTIQLYCVFADIHVRAVIVDSSTMLCEIPRHPPGIVSFRVADQYDRTLDTSTELSSQFKFVPEPSIEVVNMNPSENATRAGLIFARGSNFGNSSEMSCIFGDAEQMTATVLAESILICETPQEGIGNMVNVSITHLGSEYSSQSLLPVGLDELLNAPNGTTMGHNVTLCEPGTFKPRSDQGMCLPCPVGYLCPLRGMSQPIVCPEGHICSKLGLVSPSSPCVAGNYCLQGTKSSHPMAYSEVEAWHLDEESGVPTAAMERSLWDYIPRVSPATGLRRFFHPPIDRKVKAGQPLPCPVSYFCRKGVKTHHHVEGDYSTPQVCLEGHFCPRGSISPEGSGPCREGHYCPDNFVSLSSVVIPLAIPCDIGHYCPGTGNTYPRQCFPGSYSPTTGRSTCILCEIGRQCPEWGMSEPELCEAGFVCDMEGLSTPTKLCPGGYICEEGTSTEKPYTSSGVGPKPCPPGSACPSGTAHNVTGSWLPSFELGRISPQPCSEGYHCPQNSSSIMGAGQCPPGHYCPPQSALPVKVPPGTFAGEEGGAIAPSLCLPGTFSPQPGSVSCTQCPAGYSCMTYGTYIPRICEPGTYRSKEDSLTCKPCPQRSLSSYSGLADVSQCLPCPEGLVCSSKGMSDIIFSHSCPEGNACGYLTDGSSQYDHKCAAGHYCGEETTTFDQYNKYCLAGTYCERGTTETLRTKNECNRGYYCSNGTPIPEPITTRCPRQTTSILGSEAMSMCLPESVAICDKMSHIESNPFDRMSYYPLDKSLEDAAALREMAVVQKVLPFNRHTSNVEMWKNDTIEVTRACPSYIVQPGWTPKPSYGVRAEETPDEWTRESITIVGRNFRNSTALTCRYRVCLSSGWKNDKGDEIAVPERCFSDLTTSHLSEAETRAGTFISESRVSCPLPNTIVQDKLLKSVNETDAEELSSQSLCVRDDEGGPFLLQKCSDIEIASGQCSRDDTVPELGLGRRIYSLFVTCSHEEVSRGLCANVPSSSLKLNPCFTSQVIVDVSNNGDKFSSDSTTIPYSLIDSDRDLPAFKSPPTYATYYVIDDHVLDAFESQNNAINRKQLISSFESDEAQCNLISSHEEEHRLDSDGWVEAAYMNQFHLSFDWRLLPKHLVYDDHFRLAIHIVPSRCNESKCDDSTRHIRHEENIPCLQPVQLPEWFTDASIDKNQFMNITILSLDDARFRVEVQLTHGLALPFADFFERTMTVIREQPQRAKTDLSASRTLSPLISWDERTVEMPWIFGIRYDESYSHSTSLPMNLPPRWKSFERGRVLIGMNTTHQNTAPTIKDKYEDTEERKDFWSNPYQSEVIAKEQTDLYFETFHGLSFDQSTGSYDFDLNSLILPYLPFFSNCREFDSYIPLWALVESSTECKLPRVSSKYPDTWWRRDVQPLPHQDDVEAIGPSDFISFYPVADWCERKLHCSFEESLTSTDVTPRWFEADSGSTLFSILRDPIDFYQYTGRDSATVGASDGGGQRFLDTVTTLETFIPAKVSRSPAFNVVGDCAASCFPRRVTVDISYYQVDVHSKRVVQVNVIYDKFDKDTTNDEYELQFKFYPLNYQELVTKFAFTRGLFLMLFSYIGVGTVIAAMIYWAVLRLTTSLENPPQLKILGYLWLTFPPALGGLLLGLIPISLVTAASFYLVKGYMFDTSESDPDGRRWLFANTKLQYSDVTIDPDLLHLTRQGRTGLAFLTMAMASLYFTTKLFVPKKKLNGHGDAKPITTSTWKRSNLLVSSILMSLFLVGIVEWSFWESFGTYIWEAIILMKFLGILIGQVMDNQLGEALLSAPVMTAFGLVQAVVTMSANDFMDFLLSYIVGFGFLILERMYIGPLLSNILNWSCNVFSAMTHSVRKLLPPILLGDQNDSTSNSTDSETVHEENEETLEPLLGSYTSYSCDVLSLLYFPFIMVVIMIFREEAEMMKLYNIKESDMEYYLLFALVIIPFQIAADIFMQNSLELLHGWKTFEYLEYCRARFLQREMWWKGLETNTLDECIEISLRSVDQLCFSSQYYMLSTLHVNAIVYLVLGIVMMARAKYNAFGDPAMSSIVMIILLCTIVVKLVLTRIAMIVGLWSIRHEKRRWHDKIHADGEPQLDQWSHEQSTGHDEYKLEGRMTSDAFRYKFLRYNRSWIIEQLPNMLTPRMTQRSRPYIMNQLARILGSIDADVSSDSEADDAPDFDVPAMNASTRAMIRMWYGEAGRLLRLSRLVEPIIQQSRDDVCQFCLGRGSLRVETCFSVEEMNRQFIVEYPECKDDIDTVYWKMFWQKNQKYQTVCGPCLQKRAKEKYEGIIDDDRSSDDADSLGDLVTSELDSVQSTILSTWYSQARASLNG